MVCTVLGRKPVSFVAKDGSHVSGNTFYVSFDQKGVEGLATDRIFCSQWISSDHVLVGDQIELYYNKFGKIDFVKVID